MASYPGPGHPVTRWAEAFRDGRTFVSARYNIATDGERATFHGNRVAWRNGNTGMVYVFHAGYGRSLTTRQRCNVLFEALGAPYQYSQYDNECHLGFTTSRPWGAPTTKADYAALDDLCQHPVAIGGPLQMYAARALANAGRIAQAA